MDEYIKKDPLDMREVKDLLQDGVIELSGGKGKPMRFGFMAALEHEGHLYVVLTKLAARTQLNHELLLLRMIKEDGRIADYEVVHDAQEATDLIDQYIRLAVQSLFEEMTLHADQGMATGDAFGLLEDDDEEEDDEDRVLH